MVDAPAGARNSEFYIQEIPSDNVLRSEEYHSCIDHPPTNRTLVVAIDCLDEIRTVLRPIDLILPGVMSDEPHLPIQRIGVRTPSRALDRRRFVLVAGTANAVTHLDRLPCYSPCRPGDVSGSFVFASSPAALPSVRRTKLSHSRQRWARSSLSPYTRRKSRLTWAPQWRQCRFETAIVLLTAIYSTPPTEESRDWSKKIESRRKRDSDFISHGVGGI